MASILVAEHERAPRDQLCEQLASRGFQVVPVGDGTEALAALDGHEFDVVLSNVVIPGENGAQVARRLKQAAPDTEVVIAAVDGERARTIEYLEGGVFDYVEKPYEMEAVIATLERALERRQLRAASALYESSRVILATRDRERLPEVIVGVVLETMNADDAAFMVLGDDDRLHVACSTAVTDHVRTEVATSLGEMLETTAPMLREPVIVSRGSVRSCILYPLRVDDRTIGLLSISRVVNQRLFRQADLDKATVIASQVQLALENMRLLRQMITADRMSTVGQLAASIAHEINNPIAIVLASQGHVREHLEPVIELCSLIAAGASTQELRAKYEAAGGKRMLLELVQAVDDVRDGAARVRDILRETRMLGNHTNDERLFDVNEAIRSALRTVAADLRHKALVATKLGAELYVQGTLGRLAQVFVNLLVHSANAFWSDPHNVISIVSRRVDRHVIVTLRDNGPGIAPEALPRMFDPFFTTNLAIAREVTRAHGGDISVESTPDHGTLFTISLPHAAPPRAKAPSAPPLRLDGARVRVLAVDDEPSILKAYRRALTGHDVVLARDGEEALAAIRANPRFDLVVCDLSMPGMSGMQLFAHVRQHMPGLADRFVFATAGATQRDLEQFLASVPNRVLEKPFEMRVLRELVAELQQTS